MQIMLPGGIPLGPRSFTALVMPDEAAFALLRSLILPEDCPGLIILPARHPGKVLQNDGQMVCTSPQSAMELITLLRQPAWSLVWISPAESWFAHGPCSAVAAAALFRAASDHARVVVQVPVPRPVFTEIAHHADRLITITPWGKGSREAPRTQA
jgi:hypothetical protein